MPLSEAKKRSNAKWDAANMTTVGVKMRRTEADAFAAATKANGTTRNAVLLAAAREYIRTHSTDAQQDTQPDT